MSKMGLHWCWWRMLETKFVNDKFEMLVTDSGCWWPIQSIRKIANITKKVANITILPPLSQMGHHHKVTSIPMSPTSLSPTIFGLINVKNGLLCSLWRQDFDVSICNEGFTYLLATSSSSRWSFKSEERFFISVLWLSISFLTSSIIIFLTLTVLQDS